MTEHDRPLLPSKAQLHVRWGQLYGSATSLWLAEAARKASGPLLVIAANARQASRMEDELRFFCEPDSYIEHFPAWETLPYDLFSPHPDIVSQRLRMLSTLPRLAQLALVWALRDPRMTSLVIGASSVGQLEDNVAALDHLDLTEDDLAHIDRHATDADVNLWSRSSAE